MNIDVIFPDAAVEDDENYECVGWLTLLGSQFDSVQAAESFVSTQVDDYAHDTHFLIQPMGRWIACANDIESLEKVHTISSSSNNNPTKGRHGSVNDLRKPAVSRDNNSTSAVQDTADEHPAISPMTAHDKKQEVDNHIARIATLLEDVPDGISTKGEYADSRHRLASLVAYGRNLTTLLQEAKTKRISVERYISTLDLEFSEFKYGWRQRYEDGLRQSGFKQNKEESNDLSVIDFLDTPIIPNDESQ